METYTDRLSSSSHEEENTGIKKACSARIAIYDDLKAAPRIVDIDSLPIQDFIETLAIQTYTLAQQIGGQIPYTVVREVSENFIHADFKEPVISILDNGNTISFADQGPGIDEKEKVQLPGFTSATSDMKRYIRGVGSGLPTVKEFLSCSGGNLIIEDNIRDGAVVTITLKDISSETVRPDEILKIADDVSRQQTPISISQSKMMRREEDVLRLFLTQSMIGPSDLTYPPLNLSLGTASRTLEALENAGLISSTTSKKRILTQEGVGYLQKHNLVD